MCRKACFYLLVQIPLFYISGHITPTDVACKPSHSLFGLNSNKQFDGENTPNSKLYKTVHSRTQVHSDKKGFVTLVKSPLSLQTSFNIPSSFYVKISTNKPMSFALYKVFFWLIIYYERIEGE